MRVAVFVIGVLGKKKIVHKVNLEDLKFDDYCDPGVFCDWLADIECYLYWYGFFDAARAPFARRKLIRSARSYWDSVDEIA